MSERIEVLPDPERLIEGLRDTGYEFNIAVADLIDNSIAADATIVDVRINMDFRGNVVLSIADDGCGMGREELISAMQYGSPPRPHPASLGKFGLGLKTASTAFCRQLTVMSRESSATTPISATWDLDHVASVGRWELLIDTANSEQLEHLQAASGDGTGTVVVWNKVDRLLKNYAQPGGGHAMRALDKVIEDLKDHIAMIYQRFLDREDNRASNIEIRVNGNSIEAWDPFCIGESELVAAENSMQVQLGDGSHASFSVRAYILPRAEEFSSDAAAKRAKLSNALQGIYVYREGRLIHSADWLGMFSKEPHLTLLRVDFSFDHRLDEHFYVDIKKSKINLDDQLWDWLKDQFLTAPRREANTRYRRGQSLKVTKLAPGTHSGSNKNIAAKEAQLDTAEITSSDPTSGEAEVENRYGKFKLKIPTISAVAPGEVYVTTVDTIADGVLFEPVLIEQHKAVRINTGHPYYHKVYVPNWSSGVTIQGMDSLLWALCAAEYSTVNDATKDHFEELRYEVSRLLRKLVEDLPEPELKANEDS